MPVNWISSGRIRSLFNGSQYPALIANGSLVALPLRRTHLQKPSPHQGPLCTHSEVILYQSNEKSLFVIIHQYLKPDGSLGASGRPDPKRIKIDGEIYATH